VGVQNNMKDINDAYSKSEKMIGIILVIGGLALLIGVGIGLLF